MRDTIVQLGCCAFYKAFLTGPIGSSQEPTLRATIAKAMSHQGSCCYNVSGTSCKLLDEGVTTYQERLASYWTKMLQRIRNVLQVTGRRCYKVSGSRYWQRRPQDSITPPHPPKKEKDNVQKWQQSHLKLLGWTTLDPQFVSKLKNLCLLFTLNCGVKHLHIATLMRNIHGVWAHPLALILCCQLLKQFWRMDGWMWKKRGFLF